MGVNILVMNWGRTNVGVLVDQLVDRQGCRLANIGVNQHENVKTDVFCAIRVVSNQRN
jgi:hypothetical protein